MSVTPTSDESSVVTVTVTYNPDLVSLEAQLVALPESSVKIIVDNASRTDVLVAVEALAERLPNVRLLQNASNLGLAAAVNQGAREAAALQPPPRFVLLLDQDSEPRPGSIEALLAAFRTLEEGGSRVGCVGPALLDPETGLTHGFHQCTRWRWRRAYPPLGSTKPVPCANLNGSGTLVPLSLFLQMGGLDEALFIDHVDTEWSFRVLAAGYGLWGVPEAVFVHRMGQASLRFWWFGWRLWPSRSPQRHYFLFRNATILMRRHYVPFVWKVWAVVKLALTGVVSGLLDAQRRDQLQNMVRGVGAGISSRRSSGA